MADPERHRAPTPRSSTRRRSWGVSSIVCFVAAVAIALFALIHLLTAAGSHAASHSGIDLAAIARRLPPAQIPDAPKPLPLPKG